MPNISIVAIQSLSKFFNSRIVKKVLIVSLLWLLGAIPAFATEVSRVVAEWDLSSGLNILEECGLPSNGFNCLTNNSRRTRRVVGIAGTLAVKPSTSPLAETLWIIKVLDDSGTPTGKELYAGHYVGPQSLNVSVVIPGSGIAVLPGETIAVLVHVFTANACTRCAEAQLAIYWNSVTTISR